MRILEGILRCVASSIAVLPVQLARFTQKSLHTDVIPPKLCYMHTTSDLMMLYHAWYMRGYALQ